MSFIHCYDKTVFAKLIDYGHIPLKNEYPFILLQNDNVDMNFNEFEISKLEFSDMMYFS